MGSAGSNLNSTVAITISVVDANSAATIQKVEQQIVGLGTAAKATAADLSEIPAMLSLVDEAATKSGAKIVEATTAASAGFNGMRAQMQLVRGEARELGVAIPGFLGRAIVQNEVLMVGVRALSTAFLGLAAISVFATLGKEAVDFYQNQIDINHAMDEYQQKAQQTAQQKLFDTASLETTSQLLAQITQQVTALEQKRKAANNPEFISTPYGPAVQQGGFGAEEGKKESDFKAKQDQLEARQTALREAGQMQRLKMEDDYQAAVSKGYSQIDAKEKALKDEIAVRYAFQKANESDLAKQAGVSVDALQKGFNQQRADATKQAELTASAERINLRRTETDQVIQMQNQAVDAGLKGDTLITAQRQQSIDAVTRKFREGEISKQTAQAETAAINLKFDNEKMQRLQEQERETQKIEQEAQNAGLTGIAKLQAGANSRAGDIANDPTLDASQRQRRVVAVYQQANGEIEKSEQDFYQKLSQMGASYDGQQLQGYAKIEADYNSHLQEMLKSYDEEFGQLSDTDQRKIQAAQTLQDQITRIYRDSQNQRLAYTQRIDEQTAQEEQKAARLLLPPWQQQNQAIIDDYKNRVEKINEALQRQVINEQQAQKQIKAAVDLESAEMQKQAQQTRDQIAGQLDSLFSDPGQYIENRAKQTMEKIVANWLMQLMQFNGAASGILKWLFGMGPDMPTNGSTGSQLGTIFGVPMSGTAGITSGGGLSGTASMTTAVTTLSTAGTSLNTSGTTLSTAGTSLNSAAAALTSAASTLSMAGSGGGGGGGLSNLFSGGTSGSSLDSIYNTPTDQLPGMSSATGGGFSMDAVGGPLGAGDISSGAGTDVFAGASGGGSSPDVFAGGPNVSGTAPGASVGGVVSAGMGIYGVVQSVRSGSVGGAALSGAMAGASIGMMVGGPVGALIGAGIGAVGGAVAGLLGDLFSDHGKGKAKAYDSSTVQPALQKELQSFDAGQTGYDQVMKDLDTLSKQAQSDTAGYGSGARSYYTNNIVPEIAAVQQTIDQQMRGGRGNIVMSAAQFHTGGRIVGFGDLSTSNTEGFVHAQLGEHVMTPRASSNYGPMLDAMNRGSDVHSIINSYVRGSRQMSSASSGGSGGGITIQALDSKSIEYWLRNGGAMQIQKATNGNVERYSGVALG